MVDTSFLCDTIEPSSNRAGVYTVSANICSATDLSRDGLGDCFSYLFSIRSLGRFLREIITDLSQMIFDVGKIEEFYLVIG